MCVRSIILNGIQPAQTRQIKTRQPDTLTSLEYMYERPIHAENNKLT